MRLLDNLPRRLQTAAAYGLVFLIFAAAGYVLIQILAAVSSLVLAIAAALLLAALLMPLVELLCRLHLPRGLATLVAVVMLLAVVGLVGVLMAMGLAREAGDLAAGVTGGLDVIRDWLVNGPLQISQSQLDRLTAQAAEQLRGVGRRSLRGASTVLEAIGMAALAIVLLFFLLKDGPVMSRWLLRAVSGRHRERAEQAAASGWKALQGYVRGAVVIAAIDATGIGVGLAILGVPLALPLALVTFIASFVPLVGATVAGALAVLVGLATKGPTTALLVLVVVLLVQNLEGNLLEPLVMGRAVRLHPAVVLVAVAAGALVAGIGGALLATPLTAMTYRIVRTLRDRSGPRPKSSEDSTAPRRPGPAG